ncbi:MAG: DUF4249 domain-containing protein [Bacteroidales bacterium]|nr:DUF4249 domain-containing protein [Bacteroidales bacterium]
MQIKKLPLILLMLWVTTSCIDKYRPDIDKYENLLVVDGLLTNNDEPVVVKLSLSSSLNRSEIIPVTRANLNLSSQFGDSFVYFTETTPGTYEILDHSFKGEIGQWYKLDIKLHDGRHYASDLCQLAAPSPIDSVYGVNESQEISGYNHNLEGVQFYVNNHSNLADTNYYLWRCVQTYKYKASFSLDYIWVGYPITVGNPDSLRTCWRTKQVDEIFTYSTKNLSTPIITHFPLNYASTETKMLSIRYSLLVNQLTISQSAFNFWDALRQQNIEQASLYARQPIQIRGNVHNLDNADEPVLGYFTVAGITKKRIFLNRPLNLQFYYDVCVPDFETVTKIGASPPIFWPIFITDIPGKGWAMASSDVCFDCRLEGGSLTPPDFWEN